MEVQDRLEACPSGRYINPRWWGLLSKRESRHTRQLGCATSSGAILKLQIAPDADGFDFLSKKLTIGVVTVVIINQHPKAS